MTLLSRRLAALTWTSQRIGETGGRRLVSSGGFAPSINPPFAGLRKWDSVLLAFSIPRINAVRSYVTENKTWSIFPSWTSHDAARRARTDFEQFWVMPASEGGKIGHSWQRRICKLRNAKHPVQVRIPLSPPDLTFDPNSLHIPFATQTRAKNWYLIVTPTSTFTASDFANVNSDIPRVITVRQTTSRFINRMQAG